MTAPFSDAATVRQASRIAARVVDGKAVVVVIDARELHTLNEVGTFIWQRMQGEGVSVGALVDAVVAEFEVEREVAARDLHGFIAQMSDLGVVELRGVGDGGDLNSDLHAVQRGDA